MSRGKEEVYVYIWARKKAFLDKYVFVGFYKMFSFYSYHLNIRLILLLFTHTEKIKTNLRIYAFIINLHNIFILRLLCEYVELKSRYFLWKI